MISSMMASEKIQLKVRRIVLMMETANVVNSLSQENMGDYVAQLQLHMTLQARNLVPNLTQGGDPRQQLLQETQAQVEKLASRQGISF